MTMTDAPARLITLDPAPPTTPDPAPAAPIFLSPDKLILLSQPDGSVVGLRFEPDSFKACDAWHAWGWADLLAMIPDMNAFQCVEVRPYHYVRFTPTASPVL